VFDAYVNIGSLHVKLRTLGERYPQAKFIIATSHDGSADASTRNILEAVSSRNVAVLPADATDKWKVVCEHLRCAPPVSAFPEMADIGQRRLLDASVEPSPVPATKDGKRDSSPWVVESIGDGEAFVPWLQAIRRRESGPA